MKHFTTSKQRRMIKEEVGVLPIASGGSVDQNIDDAEQKQKQEDGVINLDSDDVENDTNFDGTQNAVVADPYAKHLGSEEGSDDAEIQLKVERIGAGLKKIILASMELENAMAILKSERSDYSRGKALVDIRIQLTDIITQIKTELINCADHEPSVAGRVRDILNN